MYLVMRITEDEAFEFVKAFQTEIEAWTYIGWLEHKACMNDSGLSFEDASKLVNEEYRIFKPVPKI